jgi:hypothetical protein
MNLGNDDSTHTFFFLFILLTKFVFTWVGSITISSSLLVFATLDGSIKEHDLKRRTCA